MLAASDRRWRESEGTERHPMELLMIVALFVLSVAVGLAGTRAILGVMFTVMMRARPAHDYAGSFDRRATARAV